MARGVTTEVPIFDSLAWHSPGQQDQISDLHLKRWPPYLHPGSEDKDREGEVK